MTTLTAPLPRVKFDSRRPAAPARPFGLGVLPPALPTLTIKGVRYDYRTARGHDGERVVRLSSHADPAGVYDVHRGPDGLVACDCPDYTFRRVNTATPCKHGAACVAAGLLEAPAPVAKGVAPLPGPGPGPAPTPKADAGKAHSRRGPSAEDLAFEAGRSIALDCEGPAGAPAGYTPAERTMFLAGLAEGAAVAHARELARLDDLEEQASYDHGEWAEARMALPAPVAMD